jgi:hypothetical protein
MIFLSSPYSHKNVEVIVDRVEKTSQFVAERFAAGEEIFSPVVYAHNILKHADLPSDWTFWKTFCTHMIMKCRSIMVLQLEGWEESEGVKEEIDLANKFGLPIKYVKP